MPWEENSKGTVDAPATEAVYCVHSFISGTSGNTGAQTLSTGLEITTGVDS